MQEHERPQLHKFNSSHLNGCFVTLRVYLDATGFNSTEVFHSLCEFPKDLFHLRAIDYKAISEFQSLSSIGFLLTAVCARDRITLMSSPWLLAICRIWARQSMQVAIPCRALAVPVRRPECSRAPVHNG
jgi:hypothetical protein